VKSAKSSNLSRLILSVSVLTLAPFSAHAQQDAGYAPPPMFEDMTPPMVRPETKDGYIVTPKKSENTPPELGQSPTAKAPIIVPRVSVDPDSGRIPLPPPGSQPAPQPQQVPPPAPQAPVVPVVPTAPTVPAAPPVVEKPKMMQPIIEKSDIKREKAPSKPKADKPKAEKPKDVKAPVPPVKPAVPASVTPPAETKTEAPVVVEEKKVIPETPKAGPVPRDPNESAIKGPKTMPALPSEDVDQQVVFEGKQPETGETILERQQNESDTLKPVAPAPKSNVAPASFDKGEQGALKKSINFQPGQIGLSSAEIDPIAVGVNKELDADGKKDWRVQIRAYATSYGTGVSSDRRIALSRALSLRTALIAQGVSASRIDVLAEGQQSEGGKPEDRIDLYLYGPASD